MPSASEFEGEGFFTHTPRGRQQRTHMHMSMHLPRPPGLAPGLRPALECFQVRKQVSFRWSRRGEGGILTVRRVGPWAR